MQRRHFVLSATMALATPSIVRAQGILKSARASFRLVTLNHDLEQPWSIAFLPDGRLLITERPGRLRVFANGKLERTPLAGVPKVYTSGQAGLLDICLHPGFAQNRVRLTPKRFATLWSWSGGIGPSSKWLRSVCWYAVSLFWL